MKFTGNNILITGSSRGIGLACAKLFAEKGGTIAIHYNRQREQAEAALAALPGSGHLLLQADLANPEAARGLVEQTVSELGRLDVLVNNAGVYDEHPILQTDYANWQAVWHKTLGVNLLGPANATYCAVEQMRKTGGGKIVNVSSRGAFRGEPTAPAYGASKAGLNQMSQSLAKALAPENIFVYVVAPGFVETEMVTDMLKGAQGDFIRGQSPLNRVAQPEEVARTVAFLASEGVDFLTGAIVDVNGASYLRS